ncbi:DUF4232 domain-containing protein [Streptomyces sp. MI02-7b]|uniref:DUF4232 domain-containing protein n=1 Tax=Streptomyces sp. MI02-7b TaxID=462941 RepID=UPI0029B98DBD|nr:DUF4232 domain-containing protein [Streptomyces sp. MI02-7b]MDX3077548.1 DUF4232 domain-containing protein [Streptomyces sp. MI02-7b]
MKNTTARRAVPVLALALAGLTLTACGADGGGTSGAASAPSSTVASAGSKASGGSAGSGDSGTSNDSGTSRGDASPEGGRTGGQGTAPDSGSGSGRDGGPQRCASADLRVSAENVDSGAGTTHFQLVFQNTGDAPCSLSGFPGVSFHGRDGAQIGNAADRAGGTASTVTLIPNAHAAADVQAPNGQSGYSDAECALKSVSFIGVFPPDSKDQIDVPWKADECSGRGVHALSVGPIHATR